MPARVNPDGTSQTCPQCGTHTGKKELSERRHRCSECGYETDRDHAASEVIRLRGLEKIEYPGTLGNRKRLCSRSAGDGGNSV
ncbi:zinc ribbon domain-containing protein [Okeania sp. SIO2C2]|uniref:zinc ribbon domain-containing protein n=1 Tax=Okeania sp. SIO2C2 TaxID=2607787 RepID=UPI002579C928|nr:zinc ribbon domain-containing protein [Okeania sp. SIO2C2]